jgi:very-short-patch-repair endonuclease/serine phosphatase RsbU (regulator of sigma subunit)
MKKDTLAFFVTLAMFAFAAKAFAQNSTIDSLWNEFNKAKHDTTRCNIYLEIGDLFEYQDPDTAIHYYNKCLQLAETINSKKQQAISLRYIGVIHYSKSNYEIALDYYNKSLKISEELGDKKGISICYNNIGSIHDDKGDYQQAIDYYLKSLQIFEDIGKKNGMAYCYNNIGVLYSIQGNLNLSIEYLTKSLKIKEEFGDKREIALTIANIGIVYSQQKNFNKAIEYYTKALTIAEDLNDLKLMFNCYLNIGNDQKDAGNFDQAYEYYVKSLNISKELDNKKALLICYANIASLNISIANSYSKKSNKDQYEKHLNNAIEFGLKSIELAREIKALLNENEVSYILLSAYKKLGNHKKALEYAEIFIATRDSMFREEKTKAIAEMQTKYETEKKQQEIEKQQLTIEKQEIDNKRQRNLRNFFIAGSILLTLLALVVFRGYRQKKHSNAIITEKNAQLEQANEEISAQRDMVTEQKEHIEHIHGELTSSIRYAQRIQEAVLPSPEQMSELLGDHFVLFKPKDIVSGDFYWATKVKTHPQPFPGGRELGSGIEEGERVYGYNTADPMLYKLLKDKAEEMRRKPTEAEAILWKYLKANQTGYHFRRQHIIDRFIVDFVCLKRGLVVEVDGEIHGFTVEEDSLRTEILKLRGYKVIRFKNQEVIADSEKVVNKIKEEISKLPEYSSGAKQEEEQVLPPGEDLGGALKVLHPGEGLGGTLKVLPPGEDLGGALKVLPPGEDLGGALKVLPPGEDLGGALKVLPPGEDLGGVLKVLPPGEDLGGAELLIFCVADCTGHGVPGAFMSMLGVSFLNDIVHKENITAANEILNHLRTSVIAALKQKGQGGEQKDGMDMGLCVINTETRQMQFAGGYNPCWVIPNPEFTHQRIIEPIPEGEPADGSRIIQLKPDKMPIAIHKNIEPFTNNIVQLAPGDQVYLMSDGFQDQFGGPGNKKFMVKNLRKLVIDNANLPLGQQHEALCIALEDWKKGAEQIDDITILGFRM